MVKYLLYDANYGSMSVFVNKPLSNNRILKPVFCT